MHQGILWASDGHMGSAWLFSITHSQAKLRKPMVKGLTKPLVCKASHWGTGYSEAGQGTGLHGSHYLLEQTTMILCSYLEVTLSSKQVLKAKASKNIFIYKIQNRHYSYKDL